MSLYCPNCGEALEMGVKFCANCGESSSSNSVKTMKESGSTKANQDDISICFMISNNRYFDQKDFPLIQNRLKTLNETNWQALSHCNFKDPKLSLALSILGGTIGLDRFMIGDIGLGIGKLITLGGCGIWAFIDWFLISNATKKKNLYLFNYATL